ncbi:MAG: preprotein translocase subunit YajC [Ruminococcaceae bacterium]|nr:preprotein translocase subunit YajC [Oscillospiraceae bacterium]
MFETIVYAAEETAKQGAQQQGSVLSMVGSFLPMILLIAVFWFLLIRPQKKKEKELKNMIAALKVGDVVATIGGIHGKIVKVKDEVFVIESGAGANKATITVDRGSVARYLKRGSGSDVEIADDVEDIVEE